VPAGKRRGGQEGSLAPRLFKTARLRPTGCPPQAPREKSELETTPLPARSARASLAHPCGQPVTFGFRTGNTGTLRIRGDAAAAGTGAPGTHTVRESLYNSPSAIGHLETAGRGITVAHMAFCHSFTGRRLLCGQRWRGFAPGGRSALSLSGRVSWGGRLACSLAVSRLTQGAGRRVGALCVFTPIAFSQAQVAAVLFTSGGYGVPAGTCKIRSFVLKLHHPKPSEIVGCTRHQERST
jgi:hypothetical protein